MDTFIDQRQQLIKEIELLPREALLELANFVEYLRYKTNQTPSRFKSQATIEIRGKTPADILMEIAALPMEGKQDEFSAQEHDRILYAQPDNP